MPEGAEAEQEEEEAKGGIDLLLDMAASGGAETAAPALLPRVPMKPVALTNNVVAQLQIEMAF